MYLYGRHEHTIYLKDHTAPPGFALFLEAVNDLLYWELIYYRHKFSNFVLEKINLVFVSDNKPRQLGFHCFYRLKLFPNAQSFTQLGHLVSSWITPRYK